MLIRSKWNVFKSIFTWNLPTPPSTVDVESNLAFFVAKSWLLLSDAGAITAAWLKSSSLPRYTKKEKRDKKTNFTLNIFPHQSVLASAAFFVIELHPLHYSQHFNYSEFMNTKTETFHVTVLRVFVSFLFDSDLNINMWRRCDPIWCGHDAVRCFSLVIRCSICIDSPIPKRRDNEQ